MVFSQFLSDPYESKIKTPLYDPDTLIHTHMIAHAHTYIQDGNLERRKMLTINQKHIPL